MSPNEVVAHYAGETRGIMITLVFLLTLLIITAIVLGLALFFQRRVIRRLGRDLSLERKFKANRDDEIASRTTRIAELTNEFAQFREDAELLKTEVRRADAIRTKTELRLKAQNAELDDARRALQSAKDQNGYLRAIVESAGLAGMTAAIDVDLSTRPAGLPATAPAADPAPARAPSAAPPSVAAALRPVPTLRDAIPGLTVTSTRGGDVG